MNNRDPFNLRRSVPAFSLLRPAADLAVKSANTLQEQLQRHLPIQPPPKEQLPEQSSEDPPSSAAGGMSYAFPPSSSSTDIDDGPRARDTAAWQPRRIPQAEQNGLSESVTNMFKTKDELPMYKDKPYNYSTSQKRLPYFTKRRTVLALFGLLLIILTWTGVLHPHHEDDKRRSFGFFPKTDYGEFKWTERKEKVKDAFKISWKAYEDHAWGEYGACSPKVAKY